LQYGGRPPSWMRILLFWTTHDVICAVWLPCQNLVSIQYSPPEILRFYNFATLAGKCLTTPPFWRFFGGFEPLNIVGRHSNPEKAHPWVTTRHLSHKWLNSVQGFDLGRVVRKKYDHDRTIKKSQKRNISHIWGKLPVKILQFGTGVDVLEVVTWAEFWSWKFNGCKFYRGSNFGLLHWLCLWALIQCSATALPVMALSCIVCEM